MTKKIKVHVNVMVEVELDEAKFDDAFMQEFRENFYPFESLEDHAKHIAQMEAREILKPFTEGYGLLDKMGISARQIEWWQEVEQ